MAKVSCEDLKELLSKLEFQILGVFKVRSTPWGRKFVQIPIRGPLEHLKDKYAVLVSVYPLPDGALIYLKSREEM